MIELLVGISYYQWGALIFGVLYIFFAAKGHKQCWIYLLLSTLLTAREDFYYTSLYFDGILQLFYAALAGMNLWMWKTSGKSTEGGTAQLRISSLDLKRNTGYLLVVVFIALIGLFYFRGNGPSIIIFLDCLKLLLGLMATFFLIYKILDTWYYWVVVNLISFYLFVRTGAPALAFLYFIYLIASIRIFRMWKTTHSK